jgi:DNA repair protein RecO (recombination protein O)
VPSYRVQALALRKTKLGETDTIVTLMAADGSQIRAVAKGMRKPGSRLSGRLEPFTEATLLLHAGRNLDVVSEAQVIDAHAPLREDLDRLSAGSVVLDVLDKLSLEGQTEERLYGLAHATLAAMDSADQDVLPALVTAFLAKALAMHGYRPELEACAACACESTGGRLFSMASGGVLCPDCGGEDAGAIRLSEEGRRFIDTLLRARMAEVGTIDVPADTVFEALELMRSFTVYHVPARIKALDMYAREVG